MSLTKADVTQLIRQAADISGEEKTKLLLIAGRDASLWEGLVPAEVLPVLQLAIQSSGEHKSALQQRHFAFKSHTSRLSI